MRQSQVGLENSSMAESVLKITQVRTSPTATSKDNIDLAVQMVMQDRQVAQRLGMSTERADKILTQELEFSKVSERWVSRLLTLEQKRTRCTVSKGNLELFETDEDNFLA